MADRPRLPIEVVGMVGGEVFGGAARTLLAEADVIVGSPRHLAHLDTPGSQERMPLTGPLDDVLDAVAAHQATGRQVCVLASGDPGFFGIARTLSHRFEVRVHPAPSSVALAFARQGWSWDDATVVSAHGRPLEPAVAAVAGSTRVAVLTDPTNRPQALGTALRAGGHVRDVVVASRLGEPDESITATDVAGLADGRFDPMSVVLLTAPDTVTAEPNLRWGRPEHEFAHRDGMITKAEVRAVALGKLSLPPRGVLWDVGAGSGSVGIEAAAVAPGLRVVAVERDDHAAAQITKNAQVHAVDVEVVTGSAPAALDPLPDPDRIFIGGGGIDVLDACLQRLRPGGVLVATYVLLDRALAAHGRLGQMVQIRVDRCVPLGAVGVRMEPMNPVFVCWGPT